MPIPTYDERVGTLLGGKYRLGPILGRGGMGAVFEARHEWTDRPVAVKILNHEHVENPEAAGRFLREARVAAGLKHPNVVDVLDMGEDADHTVYMVLELLEGEALSRILSREKTLPFERAAELLIPVMRAVAHAHTRNVVHRDLKPENIIVHRDGAGDLIPKILDFGIAKALDDKQDASVTQTGFVMGTPSYMSPEQGEGIPERIGPPADVWSMGVVWYEALTGSLPFDGPTPTAVLLAVNSAKFVRLVKKLPTLPVALANVIDKAMMRDMTRRYPDMGAFLDALLKAMSGATDSLPPPGMRLSATPSQSGWRATAPSREPSDPSPWQLNPTDSSPDLESSDAVFEFPLIELGPVGRNTLADPITMGEATEEPVVLLRKPRRKSRSYSRVAAVVAALAGAALTAALLMRHHVPPHPAPTTAVAPATPTRSPPTPPEPTHGPPTSPIAPAPTPGAPVAESPAPNAPSRHSHHAHGINDDLTRPLAIFVEPPHAVPVAPPTPAPQAVPPTPTPTPPPTPPHAVPATPTRPSLPNENAPLTDYDHAP